MRLGDAGRAASRALATAAAAAAVASLLAPPPAAAEEIKPGDDNEAEPSHDSGQSACVGDAADEQGFVDVPAGHYARAAINCLAYYRITSGTGDGTTFSPDAAVTADQMRGFMEAAARLAGADRAAVLGDFDAAGDAPVTRGEAAELIVRLLAAATGRTSLRNIEIDDDGNVKIDRTQPDDWFADSRATQPRRIDSAVSALYELGVARGGSDGSFEPDEPLTRGAAAVLITGALAYTRVRPEGVTIQQHEPGEVVVSVRDARFRPIRNVPFDVFSASTRLVGTTAFKTDGTCGVVKVPAGGDGGSKCRIGPADPLSGGDGDLVLAVAVDQRGGTTVWAWTGEEDDRVTDGGAGLASVRLAASQVPATGAKVTHDLPQGAHRVHFDETVTVTVQLIDAKGNDAAPPEDGASYRVAVSTWRGLDGGPANHNGPVYSVRSFTEKVDDTGKLTFELTAEDPYPHYTGQGDSSADEVLIQYQVSNGEGNNLSAPRGADTGGVASCSPDPNVALPRLPCPLFSDEERRIHRVEVTTATKFGTPPARLGSAVNTATVIVTDQYGDPVRGVEVLLTSSIDPDNVGSSERKVELRTRALVTGKDGRVPIPYQYLADETVLETIGAQLPGPDRRFGDNPETDVDESEDDIVLCARYSSSTDTRLNDIEECDSSASSPYLQTTTFYWLAEPRDARSPSGGAPVLLSRVVENTIIVNELTGAGQQRRSALIAYDVNDHLYHDGQPVTLEDFQDELAQWERDLADGTVPFGTPCFQLAWDFLRSASGISVLKLTGKASGCRMSG